MQTHCNLLSHLATHAFRSFTECMLLYHCRFVLMVGSPADPEERLRDIWALGAVAPLAVLVPIPLAHV